MTPFVFNMNHTATYWPRTGGNGYPGGNQYGTAVVIKCRWQDTQELFRDTSGEQVMSSAVIYSDRELARGGKLALDDFTGQSPVEDAREIRQVQSSPALKRDVALNKVWL